MQSEGHMAAVDAFRRLNSQQAGDQHQQQQQQQQQRLLASQHIRQLEDDKYVLVRVHTCRLDVTFRHFDVRFRH